MIITVAPTIEIVAVGGDTLIERDCTATAILVETVGVVGGTLIGRMIVGAENMVEVAILGPTDNGTWGWGAPRAALLQRHGRSR